MKLSRTQQELFDAMKAGVEVIHVLDSRHRRDFVFRADTKKGVTAAAYALVEKGLARSVSANGQRRLVLVEPKPEKGE